MRESSVVYDDEVKKASILMAAGTPLICFDTETTGISSASDRIISFSAIKVVMNNGLPEEADRMDILINPERPIPPEATKVNHITDELVSAAGKEAVVFLDIKRFFGDNPFVCGYNSVSFDAKFLQAMYSRCGNLKFTPILHVDVAKMAKEKLDLRSYTLQSVAKELGVDGGLSFHKSIDDVIATFRCFMILKKDYDVKEDKNKYSMSVKVVGCTYWAGPNYRLERIYIQTHPYTKTFYDIYRKEWKSDSDIDLKKVKRDTLAFTQTNDESELVKKLKIK